MTSDEVTTQADDAMRQTDGRAVVVAPGCVIPVATPAATIQAALRAVQGVNAG
jgi:uroporphyrinogen decarboxylase